MFSEFLCLFFIFFESMSAAHCLMPAGDPCSNHFNSFALSNWIKQHFVFYNSMWLSGSYIRCLIWFGLHCQSNSQQKAVCIDNPVKWCQGINSLPWFNFVLGSPCFLWVVGGHYSCHFWHWRDMRSLRVLTQFSCQSIDSQTENHEVLYMLKH